MLKVGDLDQDSSKIHRVFKARFGVVRALNTVFNVSRRALPIFKCDLILRQSHQPFDLAFGRLSSLFADRLDEPSSRPRALG